MLTTNQWLDKLAAAHVDFWSHGMLPPMFAPPREPTKPAEDDEDDNSPTDVKHVTSNVTLAHTCGMSNHSKILIMATNNIYSSS